MKEEYEMCSTLDNCTLVLSLAITQSTKLHYGVWFGTFQQAAPLRTKIACCLIGQSALLSPFMVFVLLTFRSKLTAKLEWLQLLLLRRYGDLVKPIQSALRMTHDRL